MPLSFGIPLGLLFVLVGALLFFATNNRTMAKVIFGIGAAIIAFTVVMIMLAVSSM